MLFGIALEGTASIWYFMSGSGLHFCSARLCEGRCGDRRRAGRLLHGTPEPNRVAVFPVDLGRPILDSNGAGDCFVAGYLIKRLS
jgi:sugar/nucleoside kinase (ribokinase family)